MSDTDVISITTSLPDTAFGILSFSGTERFSRLYEYTAQLHSGTELLDPDKLLDNPATITLGNVEKNGRYMSGIVSSVRQMPYATKTYWRYSITIVPKLYFLGQTKDCRFFHAMTVPAIVEQIFGEFSVTFESKLQATYKARDYTVQFNESYLQFVQRILEDEGIFYFFTHTASAHTLVLADKKTAFQNIQNHEIHLTDTPGAQFTNLSEIRREDSTVLGKITVDDYNPEVNSMSDPAVQIRGTEPTVLKATGASSRTHYTWPAVRGTASDATAKAKWRMLAAEAYAQLYRGTGGAPDFVTGGKFTLADDPMGINNYVIQSVSYAVNDAATGASTGGRSNISMSFTAFPATVDWHEPPTTTQPVMAGIYTGLVIGPEGEEIYTDKFGRIQVWFPWDTQSEIKAASTFWARVIQPWAGNGWGVQFIPRVGMEVAVAFLEGDVNRPVVVGSMYNAANAPTYTVGDKNKSGIRTRSTLKGGTANFNEFTFDDTKGSELFFLHAEKDYFLEVEHNQTLKIDNCRIVTVTKDETVTINGKQTIKVKENQTITVTDGNRSVTVDQGNLTTKVSTGNMSTTVSTGNQTNKVETGDQSNTVSMGNQTNTVEMGNQTIKVSMGDRSVTVSLGDEKLDVSLGTITHSAMQGITLKVGDNSIKIDQTGITLTGIMIKLSGQAMVKLDAPMAFVSGDGLLKLSGGIVMVN